MISSPKRVGKAEGEIVGKTEGEAVGKVEGKVVDGCAVGEVVGACGVGETVGACVVGVTVGGPLVLEVVPFLMPQASECLTSNSKSQDFPETFLPVICGDPVK